MDIQFLLGFICFLVAVVQGQEGKLCEISNLQSVLNIVLRSRINENNLEIKFSRNPGVCVPSNGFNCAQDFN